MLHLYVHNMVAKSFSALLNLQTEECLADSPTFRSVLEKQDAEIELLEHRMETLLKVVTDFISAGKTYVGCKSKFANTISDLQIYLNSDEKTNKHMSLIVSMLQEVNKFHTTLLELSSETFINEISYYIKDIKQVIDSKHAFNKVSDALDVALQKHGAVSKSRPTEIEESTRILKEARLNFRQRALDHVRMLTLITNREQYTVLSTLLPYLQACRTYFHEGYDIFEEHDSSLKELDKKIVESKQASVNLFKNLMERDKLINNEDIICRSPSGSIRMQGYLFKRSSNAFKSWNNRRWFYLNDKQLLYKKRSGEEESTIMEDDMSLCTVRPALDSERRYCFEIISPNKSHMVQADSEQSYQAWIGALQKAIGDAIRDRHPHPVETEQNNQKGLTTFSPDKNGTDNLQPKQNIWEKLLKIPGNNCCCDCQDPEPKWASINLGITLCIDCSGVHRSLGVHISKVRSLTLDSWEPEVLKVMAELGNTIVNQVYLSGWTSSTPGISPGCSNHIREAWIHQKYAEKRYVKQLDSIKQESFSSVRSSRLIRKWSVSRVKRFDKPKLKKWNTKSESKSSPKDSLLDSVLSHITSMSKSIQNEVPTVCVEDTESTKELLKYKSLPLNSEEKFSDSSDYADCQENLPSSSEEIASNTSPGVYVFGDLLDLPELKDTNLDLGCDESSSDSEVDWTVPEDDLTDLTPNLLLYRAAAAHNLPVMIRALATGADKNWSNDQDKGRTCLHQAVLSNSTMACEFLILNGVKIDVTDNQGCTPLLLATEHSYLSIVGLLMKHRANQHIKDNLGRDALSIALNLANSSEDTSSVASDSANASIVVLLRLERHYDQMKQEPSTNNPDTFDVDVREISKLV